MKYLLFIFILLFMSCSSSEIKNKKTTTSDINKTKVIEQRPQYTVDKDGNLFDPKGELIGKGASIAKDGNILTSAGLLVDKYTGFVIKKAKPKSFYLIRKLEDYGYLGFDDKKRKIFIDGVAYNIEKTLFLENGMKVGFTNEKIVNFYGNKAKKGYIYSPDKYVAVIRFDTKSDVVIENLNRVKFTNVIFNLDLTNIFYQDGDLSYNSKEFQRECISAKSKILNMVLLASKDLSEIGSFKVQCDYYTGGLKSIKYSTFIDRKYDGKVLFIVNGFGRILFYFIHKAKNCISDSPSGIAPPEPSECFKDDIRYL